MEKPPESKRRPGQGAALQYLEGVKHLQPTPAEADLQAPSSWRPLGAITALLLARLESGARNAA